MSGRGRNRAGSYAYLAYTVHLVTPPKRRLALPLTMSCRS
jgi:hypothetical protein